MRFHACRNSPHIAKRVRPADCRSGNSHSALNVITCERQILIAVQTQFERQLRWSGWSLTASKVLGTAVVIAAFAAVRPLERGIFLAAALIELGPVLLYLTIAFSRLQANIASIASDVDSGDVRLGRGRVRSLLGIKQVIQDIRTGALVCTPAQSIKLAGILIAERVLYRYAPNSRFALGLECERLGLCEAVMAEYCHTASFALICGFQRRQVLVESR